MGQVDTVLGQLTHRQRQQVMAELAADEGRVKSLAIVEERGNRSVLSALPGETRSS